jgi:hypothetical protein
MEIQQLDVDKFINWDITNVLEEYLGYRYNDIPAMYYKYDDQSNEDIHGLNSNKDFKNMINGIINGRRKRLHMFVDHEKEEPVEPVPIEVVAPMLLLSQTHLEVEIQYSKMMCQITVHNQRSSLLCSQHSSLPGSLPRNLGQSIRQPRQQPQEEEDDEYLELSDFEVTDGEEEDIFTESEKNVLRQAREETSKWYQSWDKTSTLKKGCDAINDQDDMSSNSETFDSMGSEEDDEGEHHPRRGRRYPE